MLIQNGQPSDGFFIFNNLVINTKLQIYDIINKGKAINFGCCNVSC